MQFEDKSLHPYQGAEPYIFLSYSHKDADQAADLLRNMNAAGFHVWYDEGLVPGTEWDEHVARRVATCGYFIALVSSAYLSSTNCRDELNFARDKERPRLLIYLEDVSLPLGMEMRMGRQLAIHKYKYAREEAFYDKLFLTDGLELCRDASVPPQPAAVEPPAQSWAGAAPAQVRSASAKRPRLPLRRALSLRIARTVAAAKANAMTVVLPAAAVFVTIALLLALLFAPGSRYKWAMNLVKSGKYEKAITALEKLDGYKDSAEQLAAVKKQAAYADAAALYAAGQANEAYARLLELDDADLALSFLAEKAEAGDADAMYLLGCLYEDGNYVKQSFETALEWYLKAAAAGNADAMFNIGYLYDVGAIGQDYQKAMSWYLKAAKAGSAWAMTNIGVLYAAGLGVTQDYATAFEWFMRAAETGNANAMFNVGYCYENGQGVEQDYDKAAVWYLKAAEGGDIWAMSSIGLLYASGLGVPQNYQKAVEWFRQAAEAGEPNAMFYLGFCYENGHGVTQDPDMAKQWYDRAMAAGYAA